MQLHLLNLTFRCKFIIKLKYLNFSYSIHYKYSNVNNERDFNVISKIESKNFIAKTVNTN